MLPDPLHPAVVHFPIALAILAPFVTALLIGLLRSGRVPVRTWTVVLALQAIIATSAWVASETGEREEDRAEAVVSGALIHEHEEAAEWVVRVAGITVVIAAAGLLSGPIGWAARIATLLAMGIVAAATYRTASLGGELVYRHGAAAAYVTVESGDPGASRGLEHDDDLDHDAGLEHDADHDADRDHDDD